MANDPKSTPTDKDEFGLPEPLRELFRLGFDASKLEPGQIRGTSQDFEAAMQKVLPHLVRQQQEAVTRARNLFLQDDPDGTARSVLERMDRLTESGDLFESNALCGDEAFAALLDRAATADESGNDEDAAAMYALLQVLRPDQPLPFINGFNIVWRRAGVKVAAECYAATAPMMIDPIFYYYAADCFESAGLMDDARGAIAYAKEALENEGLGYDIDDAMADRIRSYYDELRAGADPEKRPPPGTPLA